jgi:uncharacterized protein (TIGR03066 family)
MNTSRLLAVGVVACVLVVGARADDKKEKPDHAKLLVGKWEITKVSNGAQELPVGTVIEFATEGKMKIVAKGDDGKERTLNGTYKLEDGKIHITFNKGEGGGRPLPLTIKAISDKELTLAPKEGVTIESKRVK